MKTMLYYHKSSEKTHEITVSSYFVRLFSKNRIGASSSENKESCLVCFLLKIAVAIPLKKSKTRKTNVFLSGICFIYLFLLSFLLLFLLPHRLPIRKGLHHRRRISGNLRIRRSVPSGTVRNPARFPHSLHIFP